MPTILALTTGQQSVSATGAVTPTAGVDVSGITGDFMINIDVQSLTAGKTARIQIEDTTNAFTASTALFVDNLTGLIGQGGTSWVAGTYNPVTFKRTIRKQDLPNSNFGVSGGKCRVNVTAIDSSASLSLNAWIEY